VVVVADVTDLLAARH